MIELHRLKVLRAAATHGSFAAAAAALGYTPSAVSQQVAALERELGSVLFDRSGRVLRVTEAGRVLLAHADRALARVEAAELELARLRDEHPPLRLAAFPAAWHALMPAGVTALRAAHGPVRLQLREAQPQEALAALEAGEIDGALVFAPHPAVDAALARSGDHARWGGTSPAERDDSAAPAPPERAASRAPASPASDTSRAGAALVFEPLFEEPFFAMLPPRHRLARRDGLRLADLAGERWVRPSESCFAAVAAACPFEPDVVFESRDFLAARGFVAAGAGVAVVPRCALGATGRDVAVRELADAPARRILLTRPAGERPQWAATLADALVPVAERAAA